MSSLSSLKVIHISEDARGGGQFQYILDIAQDKSNDYTVVCPQIDKSIRLKTKDLDIKFQTQNLKTLNKRGVWSYLLNLTTEIKSLTKTLKEIKPDVVVCHGAIQVKGILAAHKARIQSVWVMHDSYLDSVSKLIFKRYSRYCKHFIFVSERSREYYNTAFPNLQSANQEVIPSCIDHNIYTPGLSAVLPNDEFHVITTCYINKWKGLELFLDIANVIQQKGHNEIKFHIIGPILKSRQAYADTLLNKISTLNIENVILHGYRSNIPEYLRSASLYLCTSTHESSPISVWEAMATALPIVSSDVGDMRSIIENSQSGIVLKDRNVTSFVQEILRLRDDDDFRKKCADNALQASMNFSKEIFQERHRSFYLTVAHS